MRAAAPTSQRAVPACARGRAPGCGCRPRLRSRVRWGPHAAGCTGPCRATACGPRFGRRGSRGSSGRARPRRRRRRARRPRAAPRRRPRRTWPRVRARAGPARLPLAGRRLSAMLLAGGHPDGACAGTRFPATLCCGDTVGSAAPVPPGTAAPAVQRQGRRGGFGVRGSGGEGAGRAGAPAARAPGWRGGADAARRGAAAGVEAGEEADTLGALEGSGSFRRPRTWPLPGERPMVPSPFDTPEPGAAEAPARAEHASDSITAQWRATRQSRARAPPTPPPPPPPARGCGRGVIYPALARFIMATSPVLLNTLRGPMMSCAGRCVLPSLCARAHA